MTMNKMKIEFHQSIPICDSQLDHIWSNTSYEQCILKTIEDFWIHHNQIHFIKQHAWPYQAMSTYDSFSSLSNKRPSHYVIDSLFCLWPHFSPPKSWSLVTLLALLECAQTRQCASSSSHNFGNFGAKVIKLRLTFVIENWLKITKI